MRKSPIERFWSRVEKTDSCWNWTGCLVYGYGCFGVFGKTVRAHRFSYELFNGPIPANLVLDHLCRNRACVNPAHLEAVSHWTNNARGIGISAENLRKVYCKRGHLLEGDNLKNYPYVKGRQCRICANMHAKQYAEQKRRAAGVSPKAMPQGTRKVQLRFSSGEVEAFTQTRFACIRVREHAGQWIAYFRTPERWYCYLSRPDLRQDISRKNAFATITFLNGN